MIADIASLLGAAIAIGFWLLAAIPLALIVGKWLSRK